MTRTLDVPGFVSVHSHVAARALRDRSGVGRGDELEAVLATAYGRLRAAGVTVLGEASLDTPLDPRSAEAACRAADAAGVRLVWLHAVSPARHASVAAYLAEVEALRAAGIAVGLTVAALERCPEDWLGEIGRAATRGGLPLQVVAHEHPGETAACRAAHGCRPLELLARTGCLGPHVVLAHMTHADGPDLDLVAAHGATICACPSGDAHLGNGFLPVNRILHRQIPLCLGTDVTTMADPLAELRELEWVARRQKGARSVVPADRLLEIGAGRGALALGLDAWPGIQVDLGHPALDGLTAEAVPAALVERCGAEAIVGPPA